MTLYGARGEYVEGMDNTLPDGISVPGGSFCPVEGVVKSRLVKFVVNGLALVLILSGLAFLVWWFFIG